MKTSIKNILSESFKIYKNNFNQLYKMILIFIPLTMVVQVFAILYSIDAANINKYPMHLLIIFLIFPLLVLVAFFIEIKMQLANMIFVNKIIRNKPVSVGCAYSKTKGKFWLYIGCWIVPVICFSPTYIFYYFINKFNPRYSVIVLFILFWIFEAVFYFLTPMIAMGSKTGTYVKPSLLMLKGCFFKVFFLSLIIGIPLPFINYISDDYIKSNLFKLVFAIVYSVVYAFLYVFKNTGMAYLFTMLTPGDKDEPETEPVNVITDESKSSSEFSSLLNDVRDKETRNNFS